MNKSDKIRAYFRKHPDAEVAKVAAKFEAPKPMTYKLRKQVQDTPETLDQAFGVSLIDVPDHPAEVATRKVILQAQRGTSEADIDGTLDERAQDYGKFKDGAALMQAIKRTLADHARIHNKTFSDDQWEALEMIIHKIGRIVNGNPDKVDHWVDIAGYAKLVADRLQGNAR